MERTGNTLVFHLLATQCMLRMDGTWPANGRNREAFLFRTSTSFSRFSTIYASHWIRTIFSADEDNGIDLHGWLQEIVLIEQFHTTLAWIMRIALPSLHSHCGLTANALSNSRPLSSTCQRLVAFSIAFQHAPAKVYMLLGLKFANVAFLLVESFKNHLFELLKLRRSAWDGHYFRGPILLCHRKHYDDFFLNILSEWQTIIIKS